MCDLIDLNSPDRKGLLNSRLASPLIPVPTDTTCSNYNNRINDPNSLVTEKRDSLENNPFDMVLHKTTEYIQKRDDPFEVTLEKALRPKCKKNVGLRTCSHDFTDDYVVKQKKCTQKLKMNKTLDESLINEELNQKNISNKKSNEIVVDLNNINILSSDLKADNVIPTIDVQNVDLSILNQSVMNDTLLEADKELNKNDITSTLLNKISMQTENDKADIKQFLSSTTTLKLPKLRRSLSQGEKISPRKSQFLNHISLLEPLKIGSGSESNTFSSNSLDLLNEGFLKSHSSGSSIFSSLSNISSITKLNSVSSTSSSLMLLSNGTINRTFLESCSSEKSENRKLNVNVDFNKETNFVIPTSTNLETSVTSISAKTSISDLTDQFNKLKAQVSEFSQNSKNQKNETLSFSNDIKEHMSVMEKDKEYNIDNRLIDVDVFTPEMNCSKEQHYKSSISDTSSDSVFLEGNKINKSILHEAKVLARTFEELALRTSSGSSIDDLIANNPSWTSELLPAFDDEAMVDNLIELPPSPNTNDGGSKNVKVQECINNDSCTDKNAKLIANKTEENIKDLELELVEPVPTEKRMTAAMLLLDLKKLIKTENNIEANKLVDNLEKVLGINCANNTELLTTYLNTTNNLAKSPQKLNSNLELIKNVAENHMEQSQEDNLTNDFAENIKEPTVYENINFNASNINKCNDNQKYLKKISSESNSKIPKCSAEKIKKEKNENGFNSENICKEDSSHKRENNNLLNERVVIELLANIGKLLTGQSEKHPTLNIIKNLGEVLNFDHNNDNMHEDIKTDVCIEIQQTPKKSKSKFENKTHSSVVSKSVNRLSLDLESKKQPLVKKFIRRSISVSQTSSIKDTNPLMSTSKSTSQLKETTKRFPSDPGFISPTLSKKTITHSNKNDSQKDTQTKAVTAVELQKEKSTTISTVKNKLKKKIGTDVINKKGPMKAILPIGTMQKRETVSKKLISSYGTVTPPKSHKVISSTPNSTSNDCTAKKSSRSSKPVASSTPDVQNSKTREIQSQVINSSKKRNFSCDISPVTTRVNISNSNGTNNSPKRNKLPSPKKTTPKRRSVGSGIPKSQTPPMNKRLNSSFDINQYERLLESPQYSLCKTSNSQKNSPISLKKSENMQLSPLRNSNKLMHKVKPINLISKIRRHSIGTNVMEKENNYM